MNDDLILARWLRSVSSTEAPYANDTVRPWCHQAADTIERLTKERDEARAAQDLAEMKCHKYAMMQPSAQSPDPVGVPRLFNCGTYLAKDNKGQWHYLNHAGQWCQYQGLFDAERAALRWRPIETAPRDGTHLLVRLDWLPQPTILFWNAACSAWESPMLGLSDSQGAPWKPQCWMPIPDPANK